MRLRRTLILLVGFFLLASTSLALLHTDKAYAFLGNDLIDDIVFDNANSMNAAQINAFLNTLPSSCISTNHGFSAPDPTGYSPSGGYTYGGNVSGGQIIYDAAQTYGLNPEVLLTTLEKEQSLVAGGAGCSTLRYTGAMGYGCPDGGTTYSYSGVNLYSINGVATTSVSGTCVNSAAKAGFSQQVIHGAWLLKFGEQRSKGNMNWNVQLTNSPEPGDHWDNSDDPQSCYSGPMTQGMWQVCPSGGISFYDGYTTIDGTPTHMDTGATASLYWYTPHFSGNQHFDSIFANWFGSPLDSHPLVQASNSPNIYLLDSDGQTLHLISSFDLMGAFGLLNTPVDVLSSLSSFTVGSPLTTLIRQSNGNVYLVDNGMRYYVSGATVCTNWGLGCFDTNKLTSLGDNSITSFPLAGMLPALQNNNGVVYLMQNGQKEPVISPAELTNLGYSWSDVVGISNYNSTQPLGPLQIPNGTAIQYKSSNAIYLYDNGAYNLIPNLNLIPAWSLSVVVNPPSSSYDATTPTTNNTLSDFASGGGHTYLIDQGIKKDITPGISSWTNGSTPITTFAPTALAALPTQPTTPLLRTASGAIYIVQNGLKRYVPTFNDFFGLGFNTNQLTSVSDYSASTIPDGTIYLSDSTLFQITGNPSIYLVNNQQATLISSPNDFAYFSFQWGKIEQLTAGTLTAYPVQSGSLQVIVKNSGGQLYTVNNGNSYVLSSSVVSDWGLGSFSATLLSNQNLANLHASSNLTDFVRVPNGTIYYGQGGAAHPISSLSKFQSLGGNANNTTNVSPDFIAACPAGSPI